MKRYFKNLFWTIIHSAVMVLGAIFGINMGKEAYGDMIEKAKKDCTGSDA